MSRSKKTGAQTRRHAQTRAEDKRAAKKTHSKKFLSKRPAKPDRELKEEKVIHEYVDETGLYPPMRLAVMLGKNPSNFKEKK